jgi:GxxExxY protein
MHIDPKAFEHITRPIIESAIEVHRQLGAGLLESAYSPCLHYELTARKLRFQAQRTIPLVYKGIALDTAYRLDLVVEDTIVVEVTSVAETLAVHRAQLLTYLRIADCPVGLIINFNVPLVVDGLKRVLNPAGSPRSVG